jgi:hypothetical protein
VKPVPRFWIASKDGDEVHFHRDDNALAMCGKLLSTRANPVDITNVKWQEVCQICGMVNRIAHDGQPIPRRAE